MQEINYVYFLWFYVMLEHLLKRTIHRYCTDILSYFLQCCKYCSFTALSSQFWCPYSLRKSFFIVSSPRLSLPTNNSFLQQILHFYKWLRIYLLSQISHGLSLHPKLPTMTISDYLYWHIYLPVGHVDPEKFGLPFR